MFDRLQKPFLTVETGEAYQPIRLTYDLLNKDQLLQVLENLQCVQRNSSLQNSWHWFWKGECDDLHFESIDSFRRNPNAPVRLGTLTLKDDKLYFNFPSFKRACLAVPFFFRIIREEIVRVHHADFINKVFGLDERLPHGFSELFKEEELERILHERDKDYHVVKEKCEHAATAEEAFSILSNYTETEAKKRFPYAERYLFQSDNGAAVDPDVTFLSFYIFLHGRELVAVKRWYGETGYSLTDAADAIIQEVFGSIGIDIIE